MQKLGSDISTTYKVIIKDKPYAVKFFYNERDYDNELQRGLSLAKICNKSLHNYILHIIDYGIVNESNQYKYCIIYPYYTYNVEQLLSNNYFKFTQKYNLYIIIYQITKCVYSLHQHGFAHNDIQLNNILYNRNKFILGDLGMISTGNEPMYNTNNLVAPEIIKNWGQIGTLHQMQKADIWSLGVLFYYIIVGNFPFDNYIIDSVNNLAIEDNNINTVINGMLKINPDQRISLAKVLNIIKTNIK